MNNNKPKKVTKNNGRAKFGPNAVKKSKDNQVYARVSKK